MRYRLLPPSEWQSFDCDLIRTVQCISWRVHYPVKPVQADKLFDACHGDILEIVHIVPTSPAAISTVRTSTTAQTIRSVRSSASKSNLLQGSGRSAISTSKPGVDNGNGQDDTADKHNGNAAVIVAAVVLNRVGVSSPRLAHGARVAHSCGVSVCTHACTPGLKQVDVTNPQKISFCDGNRSR